jgi:hypothetical protein
MIPIWAVVLMPIFSLFWLLDGTFYGIAELGISLSVFILIIITFFWIIDTIVYRYKDGSNHDNIFKKLVTINLIVIAFFVFAIRVKEFIKKQSLMPYQEFQKEYKVPQVADKNVTNKISKQHLKSLNKPNKELKYIKEFAKKTQSGKKRLKLFLAKNSKDLNVIANVLKKYEKEIIDNDYRLEIIERDSKYSYFLSSNLFSYISCKDFDINNPYSCYDKNFADFLKTQKHYKRYVSLRSYSLKKIISKGLKDGEFVIVVLSKDPKHNFKRVLYIFNQLQEYKDKKKIFWEILATRSDKNLKVGINIVTKDAKVLKHFPLFAKDIKNKVDKFIIEKKLH